MTGVKREFDMHAAAFQRDPWPVYAWFRDHEPIHWSSKDRCYYMFSYEHIDQALRDPRLSVEHPCRASRQVLGETILDIDGADHSRIRSVLAPHFPPRTVDTYAHDIIGPVLDQLLDDLARGGDTDLVRDLAVKLPVRVVLRVLGLPDQDPTWVYAQVRPIIDFLDYSRGGAVGAMTASRALRETVQQCLAHLPIDAGRGPVADMLRAHVQAGLLSRDELVSNLLLLLVAGTETTVGAIANTFAMILTREGLPEMLRERPELWPGVVRECLRWEPPLHGTARFATASLTIGGVSIPAGAPVVLLLASANRDERSIPDAATFDPTRTRHTQMSFGIGPHRCLGFHLGQKELDLTFERFFVRFAEVRAVGTVPPIEGRFFRGPASLPVTLTPAGVAA